MQGILPRSQRTGRLSSCVLEEEVDRPIVTSGYLSRQIEYNQWEKDRIQAVRYSRDSNIQALFLYLCKNILHSYEYIIWLSYYI